MRLDSIIKPARIISETDVKKFISQRKSSEYQLLDVRLHEEYEDGHLPGAILVPLPELIANQHSLDPEKPTIIYCRSGVRSCAAAQYLIGQGFKEVYDLSSHIMDWMDVKVCGKYDVNLDIIPGNAEHEDAWTLAFSMEESLQRFYYELEKHEDRPELKRIYHELASFEDLHKERLAEQYSQETGGKIDQDKIELLCKKYMEGGDVDRPSPVEIISKIDGTLDVLAFSMAIEAQALDLYTRLSRNSENKKVAVLFMAMADEEKQHMEYVKEEMEKQLSGVLL